MKVRTGETLQPPSSAAWGDSGCLAATRLGTLCPLKTRSPMVQVVLGEPWINEEKQGYSGRFAASPSYMGSEMK